MNKPTFAKIVRFSPPEIREIRTGLRMTREGFARLFPVSGETIKSWETGRRNPYGPSSTLLQQFKEYVDQVKEEKQAALKSVMRRK